jgi:8-oxo-dGTP pyrophosphatase MutT (NUDIX family)
MDHPLRLDARPIVLSAVPVHPRPQVGALCWRRGRGGLRVLLVTSRDTGRWIVPKGWLIDDRTPAASALVEAWEEAGVRGRASGAPIGQFVYPKMLADGISLPVRVDLYPVKVSQLKRRFPEVDQRERKWFAQDEAARQLSDPDLSRLVASFDPNAAFPAADA